MSTDNAVTSGQYIQHHLTHLQSQHQEKLIDFTVINLDTMFWSWFAGLCVLVFLWKGARKATTGVPGRLQCMLEMLVEMVDEQAKSIIHGDRRFIAPLALTIFLWVIAMNALDFFPVDLVPTLAQWVGVHFFGAEAHHVYMRMVPTADINGTLGLSVGVFVLMIFYGLKIKGVGGFTHELFAAPFGDKWYLYPINFLMQLIEYGAKTLSLGLRLFGNMYGGELVFMLIAMLGAIGLPFVDGMGGTLGFLGAFIAQMAWAIFHILIVVLQAFIFMMLTLVYLGQSHDAH